MKCFKCTALFVVFKTLLASLVMYKTDIETGRTADEDAH